MKSKRILSFVLSAAMLLGALVVMPIFGAGAAVGAATLTQNDRIIDANVANETTSDNFEKSNFFTNYIHNMGNVFDAASYAQGQTTVGKPPNETSLTSTVVAGQYYRLVNFAAVQVRPTGAYAFTVDFYEAVSNTHGFRSMFVRGVAEAGTEGNFYGQDGNDASLTSSGGGGIYLTPIMSGGKLQLRVNIKTIASSYFEKSQESQESPEPGKVNDTFNKTFVPFVTTYDITNNSKEISVYDNGHNINIYVGGEHMLTIVTDGTKDFGISGVAASTLAKKVTLITADGTATVVENAVVGAAIGSSNVGVQSRSGADAKFKSFSLKALENDEAVNKNIIKSNLAVETDTNLANSHLASQFPYGSAKQGGFEKQNVNCKVENEYYSMSFGHMYQKTTGPYTFAVDFYEAYDVSKDLDGWVSMFVRGDSTCDFGDSGYYGADGSDNDASVGNAGIYILPVIRDGKTQLKITFKTTDGTMWTRPNDGDFTKAKPVIRYVDIKSLNITVQDDGTNVTIYAGEELVATIVINGTNTFSIKSFSYDSFVGAKTVSLITANGRIETITGAIVAPSCVSQVGLGVRDWPQLKFTRLEIGPYDTALFGAPQFLATAQQFVDKNGSRSGGTDAAVAKGNAGYVTLTSGGSDEGIDPNIYALESKDPSMATGKFVAIKYRTTASSTAELFMGSNSPTSSSAKVFAYTNDGKWNLAVVDISTGMGDYDADYHTQYLRFDFLNDDNNDKSVDVAYVAIFETEEAARAYEAKRARVAAIDIPVPYTYVESASVASNNGGTGFVFKDFAKKIDEEPIFQYHQTNISYLGWIALNDDVATPGEFGYRVDGGVPVYDGEYARLSADDQTDINEASINVGGTHGWRFAYTGIDLSDYAGEHTLDFVYRLAGTTEDIVIDSYVFTLKRPDVSGVRSEYFLGESITANVTAYDGQTMVLYLYKNAEDYKNVDATEENAEIKGTYKLSAATKEVNLQTDVYDADTQSTITVELAKGQYQLVTYAEDGFVCNRKNFAIDDQVVLVGSSASVDADIGVHLYMDLSEAVSADATAIMRYDLPNGTFTTETVPLNRTPVDGMSLYKFSCKVAAKELTGTIKATFTYTNEQGETVSRVYLYTVKDYAMTLIETSEKQAMIDLAKALLNYGAAAQLRFKRRTDNLANADLHDADKARGTVSVDVNALREDGHVKEVGAAISGVTYYGTSTLIEAKTAIRHYFYQVDDISTITFTRNGETLTPHRATVNGQTMYYVDVTEIDAPNLGTKYTVVVTNTSTGETQNVTFSVYAYIYSILSQPDADWTEHTDKVVTAAYHYCEAAKVAFPKKA